MMAGQDDPGGMVKRCLLVEGSAVTRSMLAFALTHAAGLAVVQAEDGFAAVRCLAAERFDLVVTALNLPLMDGLRLVHRIRTGARNGCVPILVLCTDAEAEDRARAIELGATAFLMKPVQAPILADAARELLKIAEGRGNPPAP